MARDSQLIPNPALVFLKSVVQYTIGLRFMICTPSGEL